MLSKFLLLIFSIIFVPYLLFTLPAKIKKVRQAQARFYILMFVIVLSFVMLVHYLL